MCSRNELFWPACDERLYHCVNCKKCVLIKAKKDYEQDIICFLHKFSENYGIALAVFYSKEAEEKARNHHDSLKKYIANLQDYYHSLKLGHIGSKLPCAPGEIYLEDPLCNLEINHNTIDKDSLSSSLKSVFITEENKLISPPANVLKKRRLLEFECQESGRSATFNAKESIFETNSIKVADNFNETIKHLYPGKTRKLTFDDVSDGDCSSTKPIYFSTLKIDPDEGSISDYQSVSESRSGMLRVSNKEIYCSNNREDNGNAEKIDKDCGSDQTKINGNEVNNDYCTGQFGNEDLYKNEQHNKETISRNGQESAFQNRFHDNDSVTSLATTFIDYSDSDVVPSKLEYQLLQVDRTVKEKNNEFLVILQGGGNKVLPMSQETLDVLLMQEEYLSNQISEMKAKLNQLDRASLAPMKLKEFCCSLKFASAENYLANDIEHASILQRLLK